MKNQLIKAKAQAVIAEINANFTREELKGFSSFDPFWDEIDIQNAYEEDWEEDKEDWKPYFAAAFNILRSV